MLEKITCGDKGAVRSEAFHNERNQEDLRLCIYCVSGCKEL